MPFFNTSTLSFGIVTDGKTSTQTVIITNYDTLLSLHGHIGAPSKSVFGISGLDTFSVGPRHADTLLFTFSPVDVSIVRDSLWITHDGKTGF